MDENTDRRSGFEGEEKLPPDFRVQLSFLAGPDQGMVKKLSKKETVLGRTDSDIILSDSAASKQHLKLSLVGGELVVQDLNSTNGTLLNGGQVWEAVIMDQDELTIGETVIRVSIQAGTEGDSVEKSEELPELIVEPDPGTDTTRPRRAMIDQDPLEGDLSPTVKANLQVAAGKDIGLRYDITKRATVIGRAGSDLVLSDPDVSRKHASIEFLSANKIILKDLRSTNGTFLNQKRVTVSPLKNGDAVQVGGTVLNFFVYGLTSDK